MSESYRREEDVDERHRRTSDDKVDDLYDALIGRPGQIGALEEFRASMTGMGVRVTRLEGWQGSHEVEHDQHKKRADQTRRDIGGVLLQLAERAVMAALGAAVALAVGLYSFLQGGNPPRH